MSRRCMITGKSAMSGNNVSHAMNKTRRKFQVNVQDTSLFSVALNKWVKVKASASGLRTVEHKGGFDEFLKTTAKTKLSPELRGYKTQVEKILAEKSA